MPDLIKKTCTSCNKTKPINEFKKEPGRTDGYRPDCSVCINARTRKWYSEKGGRYHRERTLKKCYNLEWEEYIAMLAAQDHRCAICRTGIEALGDLRQKTMAHVDHNHDTGEIRALLCHKCNVGIGLFSDDAELLKSAVEYLECFGGEGCNA